MTKQTITTAQRKWFFQHGYFVFKGVFSKEECALLQQSIRKLPNTAIDHDQDRINKGYRSIRWEISEIFEQILGKHLVARIQGISGAFFEEGLRIEEAMAHKMPSGEKCGFGWHSDFMVKRKGYTLACVVVIYPFGIKPDAGIELRSQNDGSKKLYEAPKGSAIVLAPDTLHRVPEQISKVDRWSLVLRLAAFRVLG